MSYASDALIDAQEREIEKLQAENAKLRKLVVLGIMLPLNEEQLDLLDKTFVSELGEGLYVQLEKLGVRLKETAANAIVERDQLKAKNAELRTQLADVTVSMGRVEERCAKLRESLERAAGIIADSCGECPVSRYEWLSSNGCDEKCGTITEDECWIAYLTGKRWNESGAEVDG